MDTMTAMPAPPAQFNNSVVGTASASFGQGNLLKGIENKIVTIGCTLCLHIRAVARSKYPGVGGT